MSALGFSATNKRNEYSIADVAAAFLGEWNVARLAKAHSGRARAARYDHRLFSFRLVVRNNYVSQQHPVETMGCIRAPGARTRFINRSIASPMIFFAPDVRSKKKKILFLLFYFCQGKKCHKRILSVFRNLLQWPNQWKL